MSIVENIYVRQAEIKGTIKQNASGTFLINEVVVNSSLKNYEKTLHTAMEITIKEINNRNKQNDKKEKPAKTVKKEKKTVRM